MEYLSPYIVAGFVFVFGLLIGSFLNVVIYRVPLGESIVLPGSHCPNCNADIKPYDNTSNVLSHCEENWTLSLNRQRLCFTGKSNRDCSLPTTLLILTELLNRLRSCLC